MGTRLVLALVLAVALAVPASANDATVLEGASAHDGLEPGAIFSSHDHIHLAEGERLVVYLKHGEMVELTGPHSGPLPVAAEGEGDADNLAMISLLVGHRGTTSTVGAFESSEPAAPVRPNVWMVDVAAAGTHCVADALRLYRARAGSAAEITAGNALVTPVTLSWPAGAHTLDLPQTLVAAGYVNVAVDGESRRFTVRQLPDGREVSDPGRLLRWFAEMGCEHQAALLIERMVTD